MANQLPDPVTFLDRSCRGVDQDFFFPSTAEQKREVRAFCGGCPRLAECADWAIPQVLAGLLTESYVAGVQMPPLSARSKTPRQQLRHNVAVELAQVADAARGAQMEGAA
ncbi:WhiB family transcriptional regulator [Nocardia noduli]|uniref:WhiB family transcriptional regulator n=1 Tax=Nocardia noduli TaxID=2815722 RepID=UPI001C247DC8|nr:WhiB family transcriptional regulator [Nocardia noduli]